MNIEIANRLVNLRKSNHLSQEALAEKLGISRQAVSKWERAEASPDTDNLILLARLYHVSLDELLRTDEEIPIGEENNTECPEAESMPEEKTVSEETDVLREEKSFDKEGVSEEKNISEERGTANEEAGSEENEEYVNVSLKGVHIKDKDGSEVHVGWDGIHVEDKKKGDDVHIDKKGVYVNGEKYEKGYFFYHWNFAGFICILYLVIGLFFHAWHPGWILFLLVPLWYSFVGSVRKRNANIFAYPILVTLLYMCAGFFFNAWHPGWVLYLSIPIYYSFVSSHRRKGD